MSFQDFVFVRLDPVSRNHQSGCAISIGCLISKQPSIAILVTIIASSRALSLVKKLRSLSRNANPHALSFMERHLRLVKQYPDTLLLTPFLYADAWPLDLTSVFMVFRCGYLNIWKPTSRRFQLIALALALGNYGRFIYENGYPRYLLCGNGRPEIPHTRAMTKALPSSEDRVQRTFTWPQKA